MRYAKRIVVTLLLAGVLGVALGAGVLWHQGYRMYAVKTGSMYPHFPTGTLVIDAPPAHKTAVVGDVITFQLSGGALVTHRVQDQTATGITTKGDANETPDAWTISPRHVVGVVVTSIAAGGYVLVFFQQPTGALSLFLLGLSIVFAWKLFFPSAPEETLREQPA